MKALIGVTQGLVRNQQGITKLETAIVFSVAVAVCVALALVAFFVGPFSLEEAEESTSSATSSLSSIPIALNPSSTDLETGKYVIISVTSKEWQGTELDWTLDPPFESGTLSTHSGPTVIYTAPEEAGSVTVSVKGKIEGKKGSADISFTVVKPEPKPYLGVHFHGTPTGAIRVEQVFSGTPAYSAGITDDDKIIAIDGQKITSVDSFRELLLRHSPGDKITLTIHRDGVSLSPPDPPSVIEATVFLGQE